MGKCVAAVETHGLANDALPTTKQVVGNGQPQTDLDGKNKKALYLHANNRASKTFLDG